MWLIRQIFGGSTRGRGAYGRYPTRSSHRGYGRRRPSSGFRMIGPFPGYSGQTRRGTRVSVGGCCLPIPLALGLALLAAVSRPLRRS